MTWQVWFPGANTVALDLLRAGRCANRDFRLVEFPFRLRPDLIQFGVKASQFRVQLDEAQAVRRNQLIRRYACEILGTAGLQADTGGRLLRPRILLQVQEAEICGLHGRIMPRAAVRRYEYFLIEHERNRDGEIQQKTHVRFLPTSYKRAVANISFAEIGEVVSVPRVRTNSFANSATCTRNSGTATDSHNFPLRSGPKA